MIRFLVTIVFCAICNNSTADMVTDYQFRVFLDGDEIGHHKFKFQAIGDGEPGGDGESGYRLVSEASYKVKLLFVTVYKYQHQSIEYWQGGCLQTIDAKTDDNGEDYKVVGEQSGAQLELTTNGMTQVLDSGCVRTYAYWQPELLQSDRLLNAQTGELQPVELMNVGASELPWDRSIEARTLRLTTAQGPIRLWYSDDDRWLGLQSALNNGRVLEYRLSPDMVEQMPSGETAGEQRP